MNENTAQFYDVSNAKATRKKTTWMIVFATIRNIHQRVYSTSNSLSEINHEQNINPNLYENPMSLLHLFNGDWLQTGHGIPHEPCVPIQDQPVHFEDRFQGDGEKAKCVARV